MNYHYLFSVASGSTKASPSTLNMSISKGRIVRAALYFPSDADEKARVVIEHHGSQIFPANPDGYYACDNMIIDFPDRVDIDSAPYVLKALGWKTSGNGVVVGINLTVLPFPDKKKKSNPAE